MRLPRRRTLWLSAALLLAVVVGAWLLVPRSRITQANFDRIHEGMRVEEVFAILGECETVLDIRTNAGRISLVSWYDGTTRIDVDICDGEVAASRIDVATMWA